VGENKKNRLIWVMGVIHVPPIFVPKRRNPGYPLLIPKRESKKTRPKIREKTICLLVKKQDVKDDEIQCLGMTTPPDASLSVLLLAETKPRIGFGDGGSFREYMFDKHSRPDKRNLVERRTRVPLISRSDQRPNGG
jgi:hypothetical protein